MESLKVYILTEGSSTIGFGHITRCLSLYQAFKEWGIKPKLIINGDESIKGLIKGTDYEITNWLKQQEILGMLKDSDIVIIDSYLANREFYENLSKIVKLPVYIDDNKRIDYPEGIVVNGNIHAKDLDYPRKRGITYLLGTEYIPLRREFWEVPRKEIRNTVESIMITFGGDDVRNMTPRILKLLSKHHPNLKKHVIIGKGFNNIKEIESVADINTSLIYFPNAERIKQVMLDSDIAISAGGQTLYELARVGIPTIVVAVAENQLKSIESWQRSGFVDYAGWWENKEELDRRILSFLETLEAINIRLKKSNVGQSFVDGKGSLRTVKKILEFFIKKELVFRKAKKEDIWDIYEISNDKSVRQVSLNPNPIDRNEHTVWFLKHYASNFYVLEFRKVVIGQIRFDIKNGNKAIVSISIHKNFRRLKLGMFLLLKALDEFLRKNPNVKKVVAVIKKNNLASRVLFERIGFRKTKGTGEWLEYEIGRSDYERNKNSR